jgi:hypothetical protein
MRGGKEKRTWKIKEVWLVASLTFPSLKCSPRH